LRLSVFALSIGNERPKTAGCNRLAQLNLTNQRRNITDPGFFGGKTHRCFADALQLRQGLFQAFRVVVIAQPLDQQFRFADRHAVTGAFHPADQVAQPGQFRVELHGSALGG
jgi:hypothetical protein